MDQSVARAEALLEMDVEGLAPTGVLTGVDGQGKPFAGWAELAAVIEEWRASSRGLNHPTASTTEPSPRAEDSSDSSVGA